MKHKVFSEWTGKYPSLCSGEWIIVVDGIKLSGITSGNFKTLGSYDSWYFGDDWSEEWESYEDGLPFEEWKDSNVNSIVDSLKRHGFEVTDELLESIYKSVSECDWRINSCGGCI